MISLAASPQNFSGFFIDSSYAAVYFPVMRSSW
jgi:hypothetical protein